MANCIVQVEIPDVEIESAWILSHNAGAYHHRSEQKMIIAERSPYRHL